MRSFGNYRWVLATTTVIAVAVVLFQPRRTAEAQGGSGGIPNRNGGLSKDPCSNGESAGPPLSTHTPMCSVCDTPPPTTPDNDDEEDKKKKDPDGPITPKTVPGYDGTDPGIDGAGGAPGGGGPLEPDGGAFTCAISLSMGGGGGALCNAHYDYPWWFGKEIDKDIERVPPEPKPEPKPPTPVCT